MPYLEVNQAQLYYRTYGKPQAGKAPLLLIHGSTVDGERDWGALAPLLGQYYEVLVPDCRGHGRSSNPRLTYSFHEMAQDLAGMIRLLGYRRAHVVGHSNGGNVALCLLMEHPEVVQSCTLQAANAYVSPDLIARLPRAFDPDRVARESPGWMQEMIAIHAHMHGVDYWRLLLQLTLQETITAPNYTPSDLSRVRAPVLVIQGELDSVNAPGGHAQFLATHIPAAQLWIPAGVGHNVHEEIPWQWVKVILDFLDSASPSFES